MMNTFRRLCSVSVALAVAAGGVISGCSSSQPANRSSRTLHVVAGENFWGSIVAQLAGRRATVQSVVTDPNADPHTYESSSDDARAFASADYVVVNGAGYDAWASKLLAANPSRGRTVLSVADLLGKKEGDNPHFWYNPSAVLQVTDRIEADLKSLDPADSAYFDAQRAVFDAAMAPARNRLAEIKAKYAGTPVASTESIFVYLGEYLGLRIISPPEFMNAVAEGNDPPAPAVAEFDQQISSKQAKVLVNNLQTSTATTTRQRDQATGAGNPTVGITETL
ncbi:MAG: metal ABC transporter solute-binding protein, Zn/Mn family, partial [Acidimicrobiales bacterium]